MILYIDTSSLTKVYIEEDGSRAVRVTASEASRLAASRIAYAEFRAMLARSRRSDRITATQFTVIRSNFDRDWQQILIIEVTDELVRTAGDLADRYFIRGFDATHLASAKQLLDVSSEEVRFATADRRLRDAAVAEGFSV